MNKLRLGAALLVVALMVGGCAKKELVRTDDSAATAGSSSASAGKGTTTPADTPVSTPAVPDGSTMGSDIKSTDLSGDAAEKQGLFETVYFDYDSFVLSQATRDALTRNAKLLLGKYKGNVRLEGHCDERGSDEYNLALGEKRAQAAMSYLVTLGVSQNRISVISYGKERPAVQGSNEEAWARNRRVEFVLTK